MKLAPETAIGPLAAQARPRIPVSEDLLAAIADRIVAAFNPQAVILFGSYACGTPNTDSDLDLLVVMESDERPIVRSRRVYQVAQVDTVPMDILVRTPTEIRERLAMGDFFIRDILEKGRTLYRDDTARRVDT